MMTRCEWNVPNGLADLADFVFRPVCLICREPLHDITGGADRAAERLVCRKCTGGLREIPGPRCDRCGSSLHGGVEECRMCPRLPEGLGRIRSASLVDGVGGKIVHLFKYRGWRALSALLAMRIVSSPWSDRDFWDADVLLPVPISNVRYRERGYNQSELLARDLSDLVGVPVGSNLLRSVSWKRPQVGLTVGERFSNVLGTFVLAEGAKEKLNGRNIIIVDDVITTGATVYACFEAVRKGGARRVSCLSFGRSEV